MNPFRSDWHRDSFVSKTCIKFRTLLFYCRNIIKYAYVIKIENIAQNMTSLRDCCNSNN